MKRVRHNVDMRVATQRCEDAVNELSENVQTLVAVVKFCNNVNWEGLTGYQVARAG